MKKILAFMLSFILFASCTAAGTGAAEGKTIQVVTTIFPLYDWVREIAGDGADHVRLTLLLDNGVDLHSYQPTAKDIMTISNADLFVYVGGESDEWVEDVLNTALNSNLKAVNLLEVLGDDVKAEEIVEGMEHEHDHEHGDHDGEEEHDHEEHEYEDEKDEHVWLSLRNARKLTSAIADALAETDPAFAETYRKNATTYREKLDALDARYTEMVGQAAFKTVLFGDRFPFRYLADDYGLTYFAAFSGCAAESEASFETVIFLAQKTDELGLPAVLTIEHPKTRIAETIVENTAGKNLKILSMDSMQGTTAADIEAGATYLSIMEANYEVLKEALN